MMTNKKAEQIIRRFRVKAEKLASMKSQKDYEHFIRLYSSEFMNKAGESEVDDRNKMELFLHAACRDGRVAGMEDVRTARKDASILTVAEGLRRTMT